MAWPGLVNREGTHDAVQKVWSFSLSSIFGHLIAPFMRSKKCASLDTITSRAADSGVPALIRYGSIRMLSRAVER